MYTAVIEERFKASHALDLFPVPHSHEWVIRLTLQSEILIVPGMIVDYFELKKRLQAALPKDGEHLNDWCDIVPTAENYAQHFYEKLKPKIPQLMSVSVGEFPAFMCTYQPDE